MFIHIAARILKREDSFLNIKIFYVCECFADMYICVLQVCQVLTERALSSLKLEMQVVARHQVEFWDLNSGPLQEQQMPLTTEASF